MRKRNKSNIEIVKDYIAGDRPFVQVGYSKAAKKRKEGERWKDNRGITWEQRDGYKIRVNEQANIIREATRQKCACGQEIQYGGRLDELFYRKTGKCFDCVIKEETEYRVLGVFGQFERYKMISNYMGFLLDMKEKILDSIKYFEKDEGKSLDVICNSEGFIEKFKGLNTGELLENAKKDLAEITKTIDVVSKDKELAQNIFVKALGKARTELAKQYAKQSK
jgi:hypothetical protein